MQVQIIDGGWIKEIEVITKREIARDNMKEHGAYYAAKRLLKQRVPFAIAYWMLFGRAPRKLAR